MQVSNKAEHEGTLQLSRHLAAASAAVEAAAEEEEEKERWRICRGVLGIEFTATTFSTGFYFCNICILWTAPLAKRQKHAETKGLCCKHEV
jgi:hypothetical protein